VSWATKISSLGARLWSSKQSHDISLESTRCGRCTHILPDETLSYCPRCGIPFSTVPPTNSFQTLAERSHELLLQKYRRRLVATTTFVFAAFWGVLAGISGLQTEAQLQALKPVRPIEIFFLEDPAYPSISNHTKLMSIAHAVQSFDDHFGIKLSEISIHQNKIPQGIRDRIPNFWNSAERSSLSYWEYKVYPNIQNSWETHATASLPVIFTNIPIMNDLGQRTQLETSHLNSKGLVSGLGHPSLTIISTYRLLREEEVLIGSNLNNPELRNENLARFMGEYVLAHELGHAFLALGDYVEKSHAPTMAAMRGPASVGDDVDYSRCLMHTDNGGGYKAWDALSQRPLGDSVESPCPEYSQVLSAFKLRVQAIEALKAGDRSTAKNLYQELMNVYQPSSNTWLHSQWENESRLFMSVFKRWWNGIFMVESTL